MDKLDVDKFATAPTDLSKRGGVVKNEVVKKDMQGELLQNLNAIQTVDTGNLAKKGIFSTKIGDIEKKTPDTSKYITPNHPGFFDIK